MNKKAYYMAPAIDVIVVADDEALLANSIWDVIGDTEVYVGEDDEEGLSGN